MSRNKKILLSVCFVLTFAALALLAQASDRLMQVNNKVEKIKLSINDLVKKRADPGVLIKGLQDAKVLFDSGKFDQGEAMLDKLLIQSAGLANVKKRSSLLAPLSLKEEFSDLYVDPRELIIEGNNGDCMEPMISRDGKYLFFNDNNSVKVDTHIHICRRLGAGQFKDLGLLSGTVSAAKDMAPSMDRNGRFYFTSTRSYEQTLETLYVGNFANQKLVDCRLVNKELNPGIPGWLNMDCCVSSDGQNLVISRARFEMGAEAPIESDLLLADHSNGRFLPDPQSSRKLASINTEALEYAPELSENKLRLFFTRAFEKVENGRSCGPRLRVMYADRKSLNEPFGTPLVIKSIEGFVEAPSVSTDGSELFFHRKNEKGILRIYRASRKKDMN